MNRRTFLKLTAYTSTWLTLYHQKVGLVKPAGAQSTIPQTSSYGMIAYGQGLYIGEPERTEQIYLPMIVKEN